MMQEIDDKNIAAIRPIAASSVFHRKNQEQLKNDSVVKTPAEKSKLGGRQINERDMFQEKDDGGSESRKDKAGGETEHEGEAVTGIVVGDRTRDEEQYQSLLEAHSPRRSRKPLMSLSSSSSSWLEEEGEEKEGKKGKGMGGEEEVDTKQLVEEPQYTTELLHAFPVVAEKARRGLQSCRSIALFLQELHAVEDAYGKGLMKLLRHLKNEDWSTSMMVAYWAFRDYLQEIAEIRNRYTSHMAKSVVETMKVFTIQQETQIQQLIEEGNRIQNTYKKSKNAREKARLRHEKKYNECAELLQLYNKKYESISTDGKTDTLDKTSTSSPQILSMVWDTSSLTYASSDKLKVRIDSCLESVVAAEEEYEITSRQLSDVRSVYEEQMRDKLQGFQLTEEQRINYIKDILQRFQRLFLELMQSLERLSIHSESSIGSIDLSLDIRQGFPSIQEDSSILESNTVTARKLVINTWKQGQSNVEQSQFMVQKVLANVVELTTVEESYTHGLSKLLRTYSTNTQPMFLSSFLSPAFLLHEGMTLRNGWEGIVNQLEGVLTLQKEFDARLAHPIHADLSNARMHHEEKKQELSAAFASLHESFMASVLIEVKLEKNLTDRTREMHGMQSSIEQLNESTPSLSSKSSIFVDSPAMLTKLGLKNPPSQKLLKLEQKLHALQSECKTLEQDLSEAAKKAAEAYVVYKNESCQLIAKCKTNEEHRMLAILGAFKGIFHAYHIMYQALLTRAVETSTECIKKINVAYDVQEFIRGTSSDERIQGSPLHRLRTISYVDDALQKKRKKVEETLERFNSATMDDSHELEKSSLIRNDSSDEVVSSINQTPDLKQNLAALAKNSLDGVATKETSQDAPPAVDERVSGDEEAAGKNENFKQAELDAVQSKFGLPSGECAIVSYSCAVYQSGFPMHGRMYLTKNSVCFWGWRDIIVKIELTSIRDIEKKNTAIVFPNAIEISLLEERKYFFGSFMYREDCYQQLSQLWKIKQQIDDVVENVPRKLSALLSPQVSRRRLSSFCLSSSASPIMEDYDIVEEFNLPFSVDDVYNACWKNSHFQMTLLSEAGDSDIEVSDWHDCDDTNQEYQAVHQSDSFQFSRTVSYIHRKKYMIGPSKIPTQQLQRLQYSRNDRLCISATSRVASVPYADYFRVELRWEFYYPSNHDDECQAKFGMKTCFEKSTWVKSQIESNAMSECKDGALAWYSLACKQLSAMGSKEPSGTVDDATAMDEVSLPRVDNVLPRRNTDAQRLEVQQKTSFFEAKRYMAIVFIVQGLLLVLGMLCVANLQSELKELRREVENLQRPREPFGSDVGSTHPGLCTSGTET